MSRTSQRHFDTNRSSRSAGTKHDDAFTCWIDDFFQRFQETFAVRVFTNEFVPTTNDTVHGTNHLCRFSQAIDVLDHLDLVRQRTVEPGPIHGAGTGNRLS